MARRNLLWLLMQWTVSRRRPTNFKLVQLYRLRHPSLTQQKRRLK
jgi:hypothetical protein